MSDSETKPEAELSNVLVPRGQPSGYGPVDGVQALWETGDPGPSFSRTLSIFEVIGDLTWSFLGLKGVDRQFTNAIKGVPGSRINKLRPIVFFAHGKPPPVPLPRPLLLMGALDLWMTFEKAIIERAVRSLSVSRSPHFVSSLRTMGFPSLKTPDFTRGNRLLACYSTLTLIQKPMYSEGKSD